jgi:glycosyltransferase involved in cell wall biosynthesis
MEREALISVVVPVYNAERYLEPCLNSILSQTYKNLEILCVNDGSTDGSPEILKRIAATDPRVIVLDQENAGVSAARNRGIDAAHGEWITFVDSDDALDERMYQTLYDNAVKEQAEISTFSEETFAAPARQG